MSTPFAKFITRKAPTILVKALTLAALFGFGGVGTAYAGLTIEPTTWNVIGLDSNDPSMGPANFPVGARVCNTGGTAVTNITGTFFWDSSNAFINLNGPSTINVSSLAAGSCVDFYFHASVTRTSAAYDTTRQFHITVTGDSVASVSTPTPRELYVEHIISQGRNEVNSITGPTTVYVGQTYNYTVNASTATQGYEQLEAFLELPNIIFQVQSISTTYSAPSGATNNKFYADACGWDNNPLSGNYRSCIGPQNYPGGKVGGTVTTTYTVKILSTGTTTAGTVILDFSGSSYHYNNDYGADTLTVTALPPPLTLSKIANPTTVTVGSTVTYTLRVANTGPANYTLTDFIDTPPSSPAAPTYIPGSSTFNGASIPDPVTSGSTRTWTGSYLIPAGQARALTYQMVMPNTVGTYINTAIAHFNEFQIDSTPSTTDNAPATASVTVTAPDLTLTKSHSGNFIQGQVGATYSLTATNSGSAPTSAEVSVTDTLPAELTATAISGTGWSCVLGTLTCTRSDALAASASYPAITLTVNVARDAPASVTNSVSITGGGQINTANDTATDPTTILPFTAGLTITPDAGTRPSVIAGQATALFNFRVTNTGNSTDQVRFLANGASAQVTGPAIITDIVIDTDDSQTISAPDTDIKNNATDVLSAQLAPGGFINVIVRILVDLTAAQGDAITVTLGDAATGSPTFDDQAADSSAHEVRTVSVPSTNGLREARGDRIALVDNDAQIFLEMTAPSGPVPLGSDITYTLQVSNPGARNLGSQTLANAPAGSNSGIFIIAPIPIDTVLKSGQVFPAGTLYTTSPLSIDPLTAVWTTAPPADPTTIKRLAFNMGATFVPGTLSAIISFTVTITTNDATNPIKEIADAFGTNSVGTGLTDQSGDISRTAGDGNANFDEGPLRGTIDGDGIIQLTTLQLFGNALIGPLGQPGAVGPTDNNDDYTNRSVTNGIAGVAPGGTTTASGTIIFANTVENTGNARDTYTLTAPTVPAGFTVEISTDGGANYTTISGGGSVTLVVNFGSRSNILVRITAPAGKTVLTGYATTIRATSGNTASVFNETIDRSYTGYLQLIKAQSVTNGTGVGGATDAVAGAEIQYTINYTNISSSGGSNNSTLIATNFVSADAIPANTDFKLGSMTSSPGTTGLVATFEYSRDGGTTWTYTPVSGGGGAPAGYDRDVTNVRAVFAGSLSSLAPNNSGSVGFVVRIR